MKAGELFHLTYCSNIHAGEQWSEVRSSLADALPRVRAGLDHRGPLAIGLRLSAAAAETLAQTDTLREFRAFLDDGDYYVPTINGFPYGAFHGTRVKEHVYEPDWRTSARVDYSNRLAGLLAEMSRGVDTGGLSISTVPGAFRAQVITRADVDAMADGVLRHVAYLKQLHDETGVSIVLAIEPEPACFIETVSEAIAFFEQHLFDAASHRRVRDAHLPALSADDVARHAGVCLDTCHMAVEFEDPAAAVRAVAAAGVRVAKVQLSSALRVRSTTPGAPSPPELLAPFADHTYLHQVVIERADGLTRYTDLPEALAAENGGRAGEWRVHFHVPIFLASMSQFETTQAYIASMLRVLEQERVSTCLEVETYTWDVLPPQYRTTDVFTAIVRELAWVRSQLTA
jgi:sugar phosphate isomerase/epimerase